MKKLFVITLALLFVGVINIARAQSLDDVLEKHFKAVDQDKLVAAQTYFLKAKISQMGMELPMELKMQQPGKFRIEMEMQVEINDMHLHVTPDDYLLSVKI